MILTYWNVGRRIVEEEQHGKERAEYGTGILKTIASELTPEFGDNFTDRRLRDYRQFYLYFNNLENWHSRVPNLTWTHIRHLLRVEDKNARFWYMNEASTQMWSTRELERNILSQYYYRLLSNQKCKVTEVVDTHAGEPVLPEKGEFIKNPVVTEFLGLKPERDFNEKRLENAIIRHIEKFIMEMGKGYALVDRQKHIATDYFAYIQIIHTFVAINTNN